MAGHRAVVAAGVLALAACADRSDLPFPEGAHRVEDGALSEMSGLVASGGDPQVLWSINDSGSFARLYRLGVRGEALGRVRVAGAWLHDTETLARWRSDQSSLSRFALARASATIRACSRNGFVTLSPS